MKCSDFFLAIVFYHAFSLDSAIINSPTVVSGWTFVEFPSSRVRTTITTKTTTTRGHCRLFGRKEKSGNASPFDLTTTEPPKKETNRRQTTLTPNSSANAGCLCSRSLKISSDWTITVWEWEQPAEVVESYWEAQARISATAGQPGTIDDRVLDPFGLVSWPGSVVAAKALKNEEEALKGRSILILGAGVGVEAQAAAELGAGRILATDIHPTTLQQLELGIAENKRIENKDVVQTQIFDLMGEEALPMASADFIVVADVLYNEQLASHVARRLVQGWKRNPKVKILVTDSQRFVDFMGELERQFAQHVTAGNIAAPSIDFTEDTLTAFIGSGVCINEDQTYDVIVRTIWIGLK